MAIFNRVGGMKIKFISEPPQFSIIMDKTFFLAQNFSCGVDGILSYDSAGHDLPNNSENNQGYDCHQQVKNA